MAEYEDRLRSSSPLATIADDLLRGFAHQAGLRLETTSASLIIRGAARRSVAFQPQLRGGKAITGLRVQFHSISDPAEAAPIRAGIRAVGGKDQPTFSLIPLPILVEDWEEVRRRVLEPFFGILTSNMPSAQRVRLRRMIDRYPFAAVPIGATGTIASREGVFAVRLDERVNGLDEWNNEIRWDDERAMELDIEPLE